MDSESFASGVNNQTDDVKEEEEEDEDLEDDIKPDLEEIGQIAGCSTGPGTVSPSPFVTPPASYSGRSTRSSPGKSGSGSPSSVRSSSLSLRAKAGTSDSDRGSVSSVSSISDSPPVLENYSSKQYLKTES